jgi:uncharacterized repeat protein (TIGR01451 family)
MPLLPTLRRWSYPLIAVATFAALLLANPTTVRAATCTSNGTGGGDWNAITTWNCGIVPNDTIDDVIIQVGDVVNLGSTAAPNRQVRDLTISGTLNHTVGVPDLRVTSDILVNPGGNFNGGAGTRVVFNSGAAGAKSISGTGAIQLGGIFLQTGGLSFANGTNVQVTEDVNIGGGTIQADEGSTLTFNSGGTSNIIFTSTSTFYQLGDITVTNNTTLNTPATPTMRVRETLTVDGGSTFNGGGEVVMNDSTTNNTITGAGTINLNGNLRFQQGPTTLTANTQINLAQDFVIETQLVGEVDSTVNFNGGVAQSLTINNAVPSQFGNVTVGAGSDVTVTPAGPIDLRISDDLTVNGTFNSTNNTTVAFNSFAGGNKTISGTGDIQFGGVQFTTNTTNLAANTAIGVQGNMTVGNAAGNNGDFTMGANAIVSMSGASLTLRRDLTADPTSTFRFDGTTNVNGNNPQAQFGNVTVGAGNAISHTMGAAFEMRVAGDYTVGAGATHIGDANTTLVFNANGAQNAAVSGTTTMTDITVDGTATELNETVVADNINVTGTLTLGADDRIIKAAKPVGGVGNFTAGLAEGNLPAGTPFIDVATVGTLSQLQVTYIGGDSPNAGTAQQTGNYWNITPTGGGYTASLNLPHNNVTDPSVCQYSGTGTAYDCARDSSTTALVTRSGITDFGTPNNEWAVGTAASADLQVAKASALTNDVGADGNPDPGDTITYTVTITNNGPEDVVGATLTDTFPGQLTLTGNTPAVGTYDTGTGVWSGINVANGNNVTLQLVATINAGTVGQTVTNTATITTSPQTDPNTTNNSASVNFIVSTPTADLALTKASALTTDVNGDTLTDPGDTVTYTVTLINGGPRDATAISVTDTLPGTVTYASDTPSTGTFDNGTGVWTVPTLTSGTSATLEIVVTVNAGAEGQTITNTATVTAATPATDPNTANNSATVNITVGAPPAPPPPPPASSDDDNDNEDDDGGEATPLPTVDGQFLFITTDKFIAEPGEDVRFIVTVTNQRKTDVNLTLAFSEPLRLLGSNATKGNPALVGDVSTLAIGAIETGEVVTFNTDTLMPTNPANDTVTGTVCATANEIGQVCASADVLIITALPETGETPWWRSWGIGLMGITVAGGLVLSVTVVHRPQT